MNEFLEEVKNIFTATEGFCETKNYYFEKHECGGETHKTELNIIITHDITHQTVRAGFCPVCRKVFYTEAKRERNLL
jgi:hypothetical protein